MGWPETVLSRGEVILSDGPVRASAGRGQRIVMDYATSMKPTVNPAADLLDYDV